jgi:hypothetical protein
VSLHIRDVFFFLLLEYRNFKRVVWVRQACDGRLAGGGVIGWRLRNLLSALRRLLSIRSQLKGQEGGQEGRDLSGLVCHAYRPI